MQNNTSQLSPDTGLGPRTLHPPSDVPDVSANTPDSLAAVSSFDGAFTVDVEDYFQVTGFEKDIPRTRWGEYPSRVVDNTRRILDLLARHNVRGTFFVLGWVAQHFPKLVEEIHRAGHEIGSHGFWHRRIYQQTPDTFRQDIQLSRDRLVDITGERITAYRAPCFSITSESLWALDILAEEGFEVDSSVFPIHHDRYGMPNALRHLHRIETSAGAIWEFPPSSVQLGRKNFPVGGGGYFRLYPLGLTTRWLTHINRKLQQPFMFYIHPWELDPQQPRLRAGSRMSRARHYVNLASTEKKLDILLRRLRFGRLSDVIGQVQRTAVCPHE